MIPRFSPDYGLSEMRQACLPARRQAVEELESLFRQRTGHSEAMAFKYGRTGLYYLLKAMGAQGKKVILPAYTCVVVSHAIVASGNIPVFLDNAENRFQPAPLDYFNAVDDDTVMIIPTHLFGIAEDVAPLYQKMKAVYPHVFILQDCAHSFFCTDRNGICVTQYGDGALFGMNISKLVNSVRGGMLTLQDATLADNVRALRAEHSSGGESPLGLLKARGYILAATFAFTRPGYEWVHFLSHHTPFLKSQTHYYNENHIELPTDVRTPLFAVEAEIGILSLRRYDTRVQRRRDIAKAYLTTLHDLALSGKIMLPPWHEGNTWSHFPIVMPANKRDRLKQRIEQICRTEIGIIIDYSIPDLNAYKALGATPCPNASALVPAMLNLPLTFAEGGLPIKDWQPIVTQIAEIIRECLE